MESKHTPGPWFAVPNDFYVEIKVGKESYSHNLASTQVNEYISIDEETQLANAKLIAAAPELLEALKDLVYECEKMYEPTFSTINKAKETINKATL